MSDFSRGDDEAMSKRENLRDKSIIDRSIQDWKLRDKKIHPKGCGCSHCRKGKP